MREASQVAGGGSSSRQPERKAGRRVKRIRPAGIDLTSQSPITTQYEVIEAIYAVDSPYLIYSLWRTGQRAQTSNPFG